MRSPALLELAFVRVEKAILHQKHDPPGRGIGAEIQYGETREYGLRLTELPDAVTVRMSPKRDNVPPMADRNLMLLFDPRDGHLLALLAGDDLDVMRIAIPTAVGVRHLAPRDARVLAILGSGRHASGHLRANLHAVPSIEEVRVYIPNQTHREEFARDMSAELARPILPVTSARAAVEGADVISSVGLYQAPPFEAGWVRPGALVTHLDANGSPIEFTTRARVIVPVLQSAAIGLAGGIQRAESATVAAATDLASILAGQANARERDDEIVLLDMSAPRPWDPPIVNWAYKWAIEHQIGMEFYLSDEPLPQPLP